MRRQRMSPEQVADSVAEQGRGFEVTADIARELRGLGFRPAQIDAIKESSRRAARARKIADDQRRGARSRLSKR